MRRDIEFGGGNAEQDKEETTDWQEAMQGVKFQGRRHSNLVIMNF